MYVALTNGESDTQDEKRIDSTFWGESSFYLFTPTCQKP